MPSLPQGQDKEELVANTTTTSTSDRRQRLRIALQNLAEIDAPVNAPSSSTFPSFSAGTSGTQMPGTPNISELPDLPLGGVRGRGSGEVYAAQVVDRMRDNAATEVAARAAARASVSLCRTAVARAVSPRQATRPIDAWRKGGEDGGASRIEATQIEDALEGVVEDWGGRGARRSHPMATPEDGMAEVATTATVTVAATDEPTTRLPNGTGLDSTSHVQTYLRLQDPSTVRRLYRSVADYSSRTAAAGKELSPGKESTISHEDPSHEDPPKYKYPTPFSADAVAAAVAARGAERLEQQLDTFGLVVDDGEAERDTPSSSHLEVNRNNGVQVRSSDNIIQPHAHPRLAAIKCLSASIRGAAASPVRGTPGHSPGGAWGGGGPSDNKMATEAPLAPPDSPFTEIFARVQRLRENIASAGTGTPVPVGWADKLVDRCSDNRAADGFAGLPDPSEAAPESHSGTFGKMGEIRSILASLARAGQPL